MENSNNVVRNFLNDSDFVATTSSTNLSYMSNLADAIDRADGNFDFKAYVKCNPVPNARIAGLCVDFGFDFDYGEETFESGELVIINSNSISGTQYVCIASVYCLAEYVSKYRGSHVVRVMNGGSFCMVPAVHKLPDSKAVELTIEQELCLINNNLMEDPFKYHNNPQGTNYQYDPQQSFQQQCARPLWPAVPPQAQWNQQGNTFVPQGQPNYNKPADPQPEDVESHNNQE